MNICFSIHLDNSGLNGLNLKKYIMYSFFKHSILEYQLFGKTTEDIFLNIC